MRELLRIVYALILKFLDGLPYFDQDYNSIDDTLFIPETLPSEQAVE
ncbi:hypothetical protein EC835_12010 [Providencia alcalifaciens]|uniref:Uncharacterized protein n=1 Tax=Providencia alcalifaciens TaxID=126385 RepID=A0A4R3ND03_9GAMM|nr:hypothetical protein EC835_12010 [Providencia alcalifaciens]